MRQHWREPAYWLWVWRQRLPSEARVVVVALLLAGLLGGGWFAADRLTAAGASVAGSDSFVLETTVQKVITVREKGKLIKKVIPVVRRVYVRGKTATDYQTQLRYATRVVTTPGAVRTIRRVVTTVVPVVKKRVVKVNGKTRTLVETRLVPTTRTETRAQTETRVQTITNTQPANTITETRTENNTKTVTSSQTQTQTQTVTQTQTETVVQTVTETKTITETETITVPVTVTETVTVTTEP